MSEQAKIDALEQEIESLEAEITRLNDLEEIRNLRIDYYCAINEREFEKIPSLFTKNATVDFGNELGHAAGRAELEGKLATLKSSFVLVYPHNHMVEIDGDQATGNLFVEGRLISDGVSFITAGRVTDTYVKQRGRWLIQSAAGETYFSIPLAEGWAGEDPVKPHKAP